MRLQRRETLVLMTATACAVLVAGAIYQQVRLSGERGLDTSAVWDARSALAALSAGNARFVNSHRTLSVDTAHDAELRHKTAREHHPFTVILCCSDSRVCPEFIFDQRAGSIFEVRNAGNVVDEDVLGSFEYAVEHLHVPLMVVLAHKGCGAIEAVCEAGDKPLPDHLRDLQNHMSGIHQDIITSPNHDNPDVLDELSRKNAKQQAMALLRDSRVLKTAVDKGEARLLCGIYDMDVGSVEFYDPQGNRLRSLP